MTRIAMVWTALLLAAGTAAAQTSDDYWPLERGNRWTFFSSDGHGPLEISVGRKTGGAFAITGFPSMERTRIYVKADGEGISAALKADVQNGRLHSFLPFASALGTSRGATFLKGPFSRASVTLGAKRLTTRNELFFRRNFTRCVRFTFDSVTGGGGPPLVEMTFAPGIGPVSFRTRPPTGTVTWWLKSAVIDGQEIGNLEYTILEDSDDSSWDVMSGNKVLLFQTADEWKTFYAKHKPGRRAPHVDFSKRTVVAVMSGEKPSSDHEIHAPVFVRSRFNAGVKLTVTQDEPVSGASVTPGARRPYIIVAMDSRLTGIDSITWEMEEWDPEWSAED